MIIKEAKTLQYMFFFCDNLFTNKTLLRFLSVNGYDDYNKTVNQKKMKGELLNIFWTKTGVHYSRWLDISIIT